MWNLQQNLQPKQAAEGLMFLIYLRQKPAKMTHFKNNNKQCQVFNHNKEPKGRPIYFFFYAVHLSAWPECRTQMPAICSSTKSSPRRLPRVPQLSSSTACPGWQNTPHCWQRRWLGAGYGADVWDGSWAVVGTCPGASPAVLSVAGGCLGRAGALCSPQGWGAGLLPGTHSSKCLKQGRETKDLQDAMAKRWVSSLPSLLGGKSWGFFFPSCTTLRNNLGKLCWRLS